MKLEVQSASNFLVHLVRLSKQNVSENKLKKFRNSLINVFRYRFQNYWFPERPFKGSGYRSIRINNKMDPTIAQAANNCNLSSEFLHNIFPELTMWIDPKEVSYRLGYDNYICILYEYNEKCNKPWMPYCQSTEQTADCLNIFQCKNKNRQQSSEYNSVISINTKTTIKEPIMNIDFLLDPRKSVSIEQLARFVSN